MAIGATESDRNQTMFTPGETNIICSDLGKSLEFYRDTLGFEFVAEDHGAVRLRCGPAMYLLLPIAQEPDNAPYCKRATFSIDLMTTDVSAAAAKLAARGVTFEKPLTPGERSFHIRDPDGLVIEVIQGQ